MSTSEYKILLNCSLHKPESTFDHVRKAYPKLKPTDAALLSTALILSGRCALAHYEGMAHQWPDDYERLTRQLIKEIEIFNQATQDPVAKKPSKSAPEEEPSEIKLNVIPNFKAGEAFLNDREDLKKIFTDLLEEGIEYTYSSVDVGWQWTLDRTNWHVLSHGELNKRFKFKVDFQGNSTGYEVGTNTPVKKKSSKSSKEE